MSRKKLSIAVAAVGIFVACTQNAMSADMLFKDFAYGAPLAKYGKSSGYEDCSKILGAPARCKGGFGLLGQMSTLALTFTDSKLVAVTIFVPYSEAIYTKAMSTLAKTFTMGILFDGTSFLDVVDLVNNRNPEQLRAKVSAFEKQGLDARKLYIKFYDGKHVVKNKHSNIGSLLSTLSPNTKVAVLNVTETSGVEAMILRFSLLKDGESKTTEDIADAELEW